MQRGCLSAEVESIKTWKRIRRRDWKLGSKVSGDGDWRGGAGDDCIGARVRA